MYTDIQYPCWRIDPLRNESWLGLVVALYLSKYSSHVKSRFPDDTMQELYAYIGSRLGVNPSTIKNMRDQFDPFCDNDRKGWYQSGRLSKSRQRIFDFFKEYSEEELFLMVEKIIDHDITDGEGLLMSNSTHDEFLPDLKEIITSIQNEIESSFHPGDMVLSEDFKSVYKIYLAKNSSSVEFFKFSFKYSNDNNQIVLGSNQWFQLAAYAVPLDAVLDKYKKVLIDIYGTNAALEQAYKNINPKNSPVNPDEFDKFKDKCRTYFNSTGTDQNKIEILVERLSTFFTKLSTWKGGKEVFRGDFKVSSILGTLNLINASHEFITKIVKFFNDDPDAEVYIEYLKQLSPIIYIDSAQDLEPSRQIGGMNLIVYGAPGTGKSYLLEKRFGKDGNSTRVVFHPSYTYFDFVGSYKPVPLYEKNGQSLYELDDTQNGSGIPHIDYQFVPGPFISVLTKAFLEPLRMHTLLIEEINRADAAAVFGELFQLLDRDSFGKGIYKIAPSKELKVYLNSIEGFHQFISEGIYIPSNLNIVATMNSADQGVNVLDSAFKRRWNFEYLPVEIKLENHTQKIKYAGKLYTWGNLLAQINIKLKTQLKVNEDRLIGPYFLSPEEIERDKAINKVLLYLWDDVLRHKRRDFFIGKIYTIGDLIGAFPDEDVLGITEFLESVSEQGGE
jgi:hypothetical protein